MTKLILPSNKKFGSFLTVIFLLVGMYSFYLDISFIAYLSLSISACFLIISLTKSKLLYPLNKDEYNFGLSLDYYLILPVQRICKYNLFFTDRKVKNFDDAKACDMDLFGKYFQAMLAEGVYLPPSQYETYFVSSVIDEQLVEKIIAAHSKAMDTIL